MKLDYRKTISLDAENLAEQGIKKVYQKVLPKLKKYVSSPAEVTETVDPNLPKYTVHFNGNDYLIYSGDIEGSEEESWATATVVFFDIINGQLERAVSPVRFYAISGGNDLFGIFLTPDQAVASRKSLPNRREWPYIPKLDGPWTGQFH
jgi:hypothetical protein